MLPAGPPPPVGTDTAVLVDFEAVLANPGARASGVSDVLAGVELATGVDERDGAGAVAGWDDRTLGVSDVLSGEALEADESSALGVDAELQPANVTMAQAAAIPRTVRRFTWTR
jgi:hypothetical protein